MCMMDSMTTKELDSPNPKIWAEMSRIMRIARGCGRHPIEVQELIGAALPWRTLGKRARTRLRAPGLLAACARPR
jgi:signal recognition particle GTPase